MIWVLLGLTVINLLLVLLIIGGIAALLKQFKESDHNVMGGLSVIYAATQQLISSQKGVTGPVIITRQNDPM